MLERPSPFPAGPDQESVWDYPRPPKLVATDKHLEVVFAGEVIAETRRGYRVLETSHPPVYYFPPEDVRLDLLIPQYGTTRCEWKGAARYYDIRLGGRVAQRAAYGYPDPTPSFAPLTGFLSFYARPMDACRVDGETVEPQPGEYYSGWITQDVVGPFKGIPGSVAW